jgi:protein TonB
MGPDNRDLTLPWSGLQDEDRRFRRILISTLIPFFVLGAMVTHLSAPSMDSLSDTDLPPRQAYLIEGPSTPPASPSGDEAPASDPAGASGQQVAVTESPRATPAPPELAEPTAPATRSEPAKAGAAQASPANAGPTAREKAARAGVLAFSDALKDLQAATPRVATARSVEPQGDGGAGGDAGGRSVLMAGVARGSGGIDGDISSGSGEGTGLSGLQGSAGDSGKLPGQLGEPGGGSGGQVGGGTQRRIGRSQEEIQEILDRNKRRMYALYNRELRRDPALQGKVVISITIAPSGAVTRCTMVYSELDAQSLERKLIVLIKTIDFGDKPGVPVVTTQVPIEFFPA